MVAHAAHTNHRAAVLYDQCARCEYQSRNLHELDTPSLKRLADIATALHAKLISRSDLTTNEIIAVEELRLMARLTYRSGITEEVAR